MLAVTSNRFNTQVYKLFKLAVKPECLQKKLHTVLELHSPVTLGIVSADNFNCLD